MQGRGRTSHATNKATPVATMPVVRTRTQGIKRREAETNVAGRHEAELRDVHQHDTMTPEGSRELYL